MSKAEIIAELPRLSPQERREIVRQVFELDDEAQILQDADRRAADRFRMLDELEAEDGKTKSG